MVAAFADCSARSEHQTERAASLSTRLRLKTMTVRSPPVSTSLSIKVHRCRLGRSLAIMAHSGQGPAVSLSDLTTRRHKGTAVVPSEGIRVTRFDEPIRGYGESDVEDVVQHLFLRQSRGSAWFRSRP